MVTFAGGLTQAELIIGKSLYSEVGTATYCASYYKVVWYKDNHVPVVQRSATTHCAICSTNELDEADSEALRPLTKQTGIDLLPKNCCVFGRGNLR